MATIKALPYGAISMIDESPQTESQPPAIPRRSLSRPRASNPKINVDINENPMPPPPDRSNSETTITSIPDSAVADMYLTPDSARQGSVADSAVDVKIPTTFGPNTAPTHLPSNAVVEKTLSALGAQSQPTAIVSQSGMYEATAAAKSAFTEHLSQSSTPDSTMQRIAGISRVSSYREKISPLPLFPTPKTLRRKTTSTNLRVDMNVSAIANGQAGAMTEERSTFINTYDSTLQCRVDRIDTRVSSVREYLNSRREAELIGSVCSVENIHASHEEIASNPDRDPVPGLWLADSHSYSPHRPAPSPPEQGTKSKNPFKRFAAWIRGFDKRWDSYRARKRSAKDNKTARKQEKRMTAAAAKRVANEKKAAEQQRRRDSIAQAMDADAAVKRDIEAHREWQRLIEIKVKENARRKKKDMVERERAARVAYKERKRLDAVGRREEKLQRNCGGKKALGDEMSKSCLVRSHLYNAMGRYDGEGTQSPEGEEGRKMRSEKFEKQCETARLKFERKEMERIMQRAGDVDVNRQDLAWWELQGLTAPPIGEGAVAAENMEDSESVYSQDTGGVEEAIIKVGNVDGTMENVL